LLAAQKHIIFTTISNYSIGAGVNQFNSVEKADELCQDEAQAASFANADNYKAVIAGVDKSDWAAQRIRIIAPVYNTDDEMVAPGDASTFFSVAHMASKLDRNGNTVVDRAWTGFTSHGMSATLQRTCNDWSNSG